MGDKAERDDDGFTAADREEIDDSFRSFWAGIKHCSRCGRGEPAVVLAPTFMAKACAGPDRGRCEYLVQRKHLTLVNGGVA